MMTPEEQVVFDVMVKKTDQVKQVLDKFKAKDNEEWVKVAGLLKGMGNAINSRVLFHGWGGGILKAGDDPKNVIKIAKVFNSAVAIEGGVEAIRAFIGHTDGSVSVYKSIYQSNLHSAVSIDYVIDSIRSDKFKSATEALRIVAGNGNEEAYKKLKAGLPAASFNGLFTAGVSVKNDTFERSSGIFHVDIDNVNAPAVISTLSGIPSIVFAFISPNGCGVKVGLRIDASLICNDSDFKQAYKQFEEFFSDLGIAIDDSCKDVRRACYLCYDPDIYYNPDAVVFGLYEFEGDVEGDNGRKFVYERKEYVANSLEDKIFKIIADILGNSVVGNRHKDRIKAARLLGGYVASGQLSGSRFADLKGISNKISISADDNDNTRKVELDTMTWAYAEGMKKPCVFGGAVKESDGDVGTVEKPEIQDWNPSLSGEIDYIIPFDCVARDIQQFILERSMYPQPAFAYAAAMTVIGTCIGRNIRYENIKGNMMFICMLESGEGKDFPFKMARKILESVDYGLRIENKSASGAALFEALESQPSMLLHIDEFGHYLNGINGAGANVFAKEVVTILTEAYTSGSDAITGKRTKGNDPKIIKEPNISVFGMSTERQVFDGLRSSDVADGSLARYMMLFGVEKLMPIRIVDFDDSIPEHIVSGLEKLIEDNKYNTLSSVTVKGCAGFDDAKWALVCKARRMSIDAKNSMFSPFYNRVAVRSVQGSLLTDMCGSVEVLEWFAEREFKTIDVFIKKFKHLSSDNDDERVFKVVENVIKESGKRGINSKVLLKKTRQVKGHVRKQILHDLIETETIYVELKKVGKSSRSSNFYYWMK